MSGLASTILAVAMIAAFVLIAGGVRLTLRPEERPRGLLMIAAGMVIFGNVLIWTV